MLLVREQHCSAFHKHVIKILITHPLIGLQSLFISCSCFHCCDCRYWVTFTEREHYHNIVNSFLIGKKWSVTVLQHQATASLITFFPLALPEDVALHHPQWCTITPSIWCHTKTIWRDGESDEKHWTGIKSCFPHHRLRKWCLRHWRAQQRIPICGLKLEMNSGGVSILTASCQ